MTATPTAAEPSSTRAGRTADAGAPAVDVADMAEVTPTASG
jgi:hypothetical protein